MPWRQKHKSTFCQLILLLNLSREFAIYRNISWNALIKVNNVSLTVSNTLGWSSWMQQRELLRRGGSGVSLAGTKCSATTHSYMSTSKIFNFHACFPIYKVCIILAHLSSSLCEY
jgi:hypothetical protein